MRTSARILLATLALATGATGCVGRQGAGSALRAADATGAVEVRDPGGAWHPLASGDRVGPGADLRTRTGTVGLVRDDHARVDVAGDTAVHVDGVEQVSLATGSVLVKVGAIPMTVVAQAASAEAQKAIYRVDAGFSLRFGSYGGTVTVTQDADRVTLGDFRQVEITGGVFQRNSVPLRISATDLWDRTLLADALWLDRQLRQYGRVFDSPDFAAQSGNPRFYLGLAPGLPEGVVARLLGAIGDPADVLFGVLMAKRAGAPLGDVMNLRLSGATWGLIALERGIAAKQFLDLVIAALAPPAPSASPSASGGTKRGGTPSPTASAKPSGGPSGRPTPRGSPSPSQSPTPSPSPSPTCDPISLLLGRCGPIIKL